MCGGVQAALASAKEVCILLHSRKLFTLWKMADLFRCGLQRHAASEAVDEGTEAIQNWLSPIRALAVANLRTSSSFAAETDPAKAMRTLVEQNVCAQVSNVSSCPVVKNAWRQGKNLTVHGEWLSSSSASAKITNVYACPACFLNG